MTFASPFLLDLARPGDLVIQNLIFPEDKTRNKEKVLVLFEQFNMSINIKSGCGGAQNCNNKVKYCTQYTQTCRDTLLTAGDKKAV